MRMLVVESRSGDSNDVMLEAIDRGHEVLRCQPHIGTLLPCAALAGDAPCPLDGQIDVAIDVHPGSCGPLSLEPRELGLMCAELAGVPLVVAGSSPVGDSATETTEAGAVLAAERLVADNDLRVPAYVLERAVHQVLCDIGVIPERVWASYFEHDGVFDVVIETGPLGPIARAALDATLLPMFADAMRERRFGDTVYAVRDDGH